LNSTPKFELHLTMTINFSPACHWQTRRWALQL